MTPGDVARIAGRDETGLRARAQIARARRHGPIPAYGSPGWLALPADDPRRPAAVLVAAECWRLDDPAGPWAAAVRDAERAGAYAAQERAAAETWPWVQAAARDLREYMTRIERARAAGADDMGMPLAVRRARALAPRPGDHPGGPVAFENGRPVHPTTRSEGAA